LLIPRLQVYTKVGKEFPTDPLKQLAMAINAVFDSWECDRARQARFPSLPVATHIPVFLGFPTCVFSESLFGSDLSGRKLCSIVTSKECMAWTAPP
jgi:hypothetical protein